MLKQHRCHPRRKGVGEDLGHCFEPVGWVCGEHFHEQGLRQAVIHILEDCFLLDLVGPGIEGGQGGSVLAVRVAVRVEQLGAGAEGVDDCADRPDVESWGGGDLVVGEGGGVGFDLVEGADDIGVLGADLLPELSVLGTIYSALPFVEVSLEQFYFGVVLELRRALMKQEQNE